MGRLDAALRRVVASWCWLYGSSRVEGTNSFAVALQRASVAKGPGLALLAA
jgi:hypothetical protein